MTADHTHSPTCAVCHRRMAIGESYLMRRYAGMATAVHRHLCFPPRRAGTDARAGSLAAAAPARLRRGLPAPTRGSARRQRNVSGS